MPFLVYSCTNCDFRADETINWGMFSYAIGNGCVSIVRDLGWCARCHTITPIEILPVALQDEISKLKAEASQIDGQRIILQGRIKEVQDEIEKLSPRLVRLYWFGRRRNALKALERTLSGSTRDQRALEDRGSELMLHLAFLGALLSRKSPPRCLMCGNTGAFTIPKGRPLGSDVDPGPPTSAGWKHPGCRGEILVAHSDIWFDISISHRLYDVEGNYIDTLPVREM